MIFQEHLIQLRTERNVSQNQLATELKIGLRTYQRYEYGEREPTYKVLIALADYYNISLDFLVGRE